MATVEIPVLTPSEMSDRFDVPMTALVAFARARAIPPLRRVAGREVWLEVEVDAWELRGGGHWSPADVATFDPIAPVDDGSP